MINKFGIIPRNIRLGIKYNLNLFYLNSKIYIFFDATTIKI